MVKVSIEVHNGAALFEVAVRAPSIERAASVVTGSYPGCDIRVKFPMAFSCGSPHPGWG
jgi:hypothetical protein